jgi:predicted GH43/DUF377 family glycosyl hydrolase
MTLHARDHGIELVADPARVVARIFLPGESVGPSRSRAAVITERVRVMSEATAERLAAGILADFAPRHDGFAELLATNATSALATIGGTIPENEARRVVLGASFTSEFAVEGAALCNPSPAVHPDQTGLSAGQLRVALSVREIGEGHVSTLGFASAIVGPGDSWQFEPRALPLVTAAVMQEQTTWSNYHADFARDTQLSQRVIQPVLTTERNGIEDARLVQFTHDDGPVEYRATYTAYDGEGVTARLLISPDLVNFASFALTGRAASNKGVALFPRRVGGRLLALVRSDGETNSLAWSPDGFEWRDETPVRGPLLPWELVQSGNCGSPIETEKGWLVLTHGVGPMRVYSMGAILLDLDDPTRVIGTLEEPLLRSTGARQNGYVPNVVYSCGGIVHDGTLWIPFGVGDNRIRVASVGVGELLAAMV